MKVLDDLYEASFFSLKGNYWITFLYFAKGDFIDEYDVDKVLRSYSSYVKNSGIEEKYLDSKLKNEFMAKSIYDYALYFLDKKSSSPK